MKKIIVLILTLIIVIGCIATVSAANTSPVKDYASAADGELLYEVNFNGDSAFTPTDITGGTMVYTPSTDGKSITVQGTAGATATEHIWGGKITGLEVSATSIYTMTYKVSSASNAIKNNSIAVGGMLMGNIDGKNTKFLCNYGNHGIPSEADCRTALSVTNTKIVNYVKWNGLAKTYAKDNAGYVDMMLVMDAAQNKVTAYVLATDNTWIQIESQSYTPGTTNSICFMIYSFYADVNSTVKDAKIYKGDLMNPVSSNDSSDDSNTDTTTPELTEPENTEVETPEATETTESAETTKVTDATASVTEDTDEEKVEAEGCGGSVAIAGIGAVATVGACAVVVTKKRKDD